MKIVQRNPGSAEIAFVPDAQIGKRVRTGAFWSASQIALRNVVSICATAVLARILAPADYGLTGMVATLTAVLQVFADMGLSSSTIQRKGLTHAQVNNLFWLNVGAGAVLWAICIAIAPALASFYGYPQVTGVAIAMGSAFLISGFAVQPLALLRRAMENRTLAAIEIAAVIAGAAVAIALAVAGAGYWALVAQALGAALCRMALALTLGKWRFERPVSGVGTMALVRFGGLLAVSGLLIYFARNLDSVLIGRVWGASQLGIYNRAYFLMLLPSTLAAGVLTNLMVPSLSALQEDTGRFAEAYRRAVRLVAFVGMPIAVGLALTAHLAVRLIYGPKWDEAATLLVWLSLAGITQPIYNTYGWLFTATGRAKSYLIVTAFSAVVLVAVFALTVGSGTVALARGYGIAMGLILPLPALWYAHRVARIPFGSTLRTLAPVVLLNLLMAAAVLAVTRVLDNLTTDWRAALFIEAGVGAIVYLALTPVLMRQMMATDLPRLFRRKGRTQ